MLKKKIWANFQKIIELFTQKFSLSPQNYGFGIRKKPIPDPGSRVQKGTGSRIQIRNTDKIASFNHVPHLPALFELTDRSISESTNRID
jgi:hypothetical protein